MRTWLQAFCFFKCNLYRYVAGLLRQGRESAEVLVEAHVMDHRESVVGLFKLNAFYTVSSLFFKRIKKITSLFPFSVIRPVLRGGGITFFFFTGGQALLFSFQAFAFKCNVYRYTVAEEAAKGRRRRAALGAARGESALGGGGGGGRGGVARGALLVRLINVGRAPDQSMMPPPAPGSVAGSNGYSTGELGAEGDPKRVRVRAVPESGGELAAALRGGAHSENMPPGNGDDDGGGGGGAGLAARRAAARRAAARGGDRQAVGLYKLSDSVCPSLESALFQPLRL
jgi:hypothetical protein